jgi:SAM-dependent methyltransferase/methyltransferase-like protein
MDSTTAKLQADYDEFPYEEFAHAASHPDALAVAGIFGAIDPSDVQSCRVLEIGCANGMNLLTMATGLPRSRFVGFDLSARQIDDGLRIVAEAGLKNVELRAQDLTEFGASPVISEGKFDFIIAHGFYSWVPPAVQRRLLEVIREHLEPNGLAYISYNTFPGWRNQQAMRDMMLFHARHTSGQRERVTRGREFVKLVAENSLVPQLREFLQLIERNVSSLSDNYVVHDHMEEVNDPKYLRDFVNEIRQHGLEYLSNAEPDGEAWYKLPPTVTDFILKSSSNSIDREQYLDFLTNRLLRSSVICLAGAPRTSGELPLRKMHLSCNLAEIPTGTIAQGQEVVQFGSAARKVSVNDPRLRQVLRQLRQRWPQTLSFNDLVQIFMPGATEREKVEQELAGFLKIFIDLKLVDLRPRSLEIIQTNPWPRPRATALARWQAANGRMISTLRHGTITPDQASRELLPLLDGTRDLRTIALALQGRKQAGIGLDWPGNTADDLEPLVKGLVRLMADACLLMNDAYA